VKAGFMLPADARELKAAAQTAKIPS
jgi:hypothetical protein